MKLLNKFEMVSVFMFGKFLFPCRFKVVYYDFVDHVNFSIKYVAVLCFLSEKIVSAFLKWKNFFLFYDFLSL